MSANMDIGTLTQRASLAAATLKILSNEQRLILLCRICEGETHVGDLVQKSGLPQSSVSQHLARLRAGGLVATRREGTTIFYRLSNGDVEALINLLCNHFSQAV